MEKFKQTLKKIFFLPPFPTVLVAIPSFAFVTFVLVTETDSIVAYVSYMLSSYALIISITGIYRMKGFTKSVWKRIEDHPMMEKILSTPLGKRLLRDVRFRTEIELYQGFFINLLYIVMKLVSGIYYHSMWFISIAVYYILLAVMRFMLLYRGKKKADRDTMEAELRRYRLCGIMLLLMNQALAGIVIFMVHQNRGYEYSGLLIYAMAVYSFYAVIIAIINIVKFRRHGSPVLSAAKAINLVAAMVSILSLETAMVTQFGDGNTAFRQIMTGATGGGICTIVLAMAIFMIWKSTRQLKKLLINNSET
ncbi:MAG: hypothetical protein K2I03_13015 [Lachnospiraceae bacterium]|nr:hypothetical protein [Lachnospiraceae bacterium]